MKKYLYGLTLAVALALAIPFPSVKAQNIGGGGTINGNTITTGTGTLTLGAGKTLTTTSSSTIAGGDGNTLAIAANKTLTVSNSGTLQGGDAFVLSIAAGKTFTVSNSITLAGTDGTTMTAPAVSSGLSATMAIPVSSASLGGSPVTLTAAQCGGAFNLDAATGVVYILPSTLPAAGCTYDFVVTTSVTSNSHEIESGNAAHFLSGVPIELSATATSRADVCNGSTHIAYKTNGTTTGGVIGTKLRATVQSATAIWLEGINYGSGSLATGCSTTN